MKWQVLPGTAMYQPGGAANVPMDNAVIRALLEDLRGGGFNASITLDGVEFRHQKVVAFENGVVFTVDQNGLARATVINQIRSVDF